MAANNQIEVLIIYPTDIRYVRKVGGVETFLRDFIQYAPDSLNISFLGVSLHKDEERQWQAVEVLGKKINFYPVLYEKNENKKAAIPLSLRFTLALLFQSIDTKGKVLMFNRLEPALAFMHSTSPKIVFFHTDIQKQIIEQTNEMIWSRIPFLFQYLEKVLLPRMNHVFTVSSANLTYWAHRFNKAALRAEFLPSWVDDSVFNLSNSGNESGTFAHLQGFDGINILFVGRLQTIKAPFKLIDVLTGIKSRYPKVRLVIVGEGDLRADLEAYISEKGLSKEVVFLSMTAKADLAVLYHLADVLLLTSDSEVMPRCLLEALGCGTPVVTTPVGEVGRFMRSGYNGEVASSFRSDDITKAALKVLDNLQQYSPAYCAQSVEPFKPRNVLTRVYETIEKLDQRAT